MTDGSQLEFELTVNYDSLVARSFPEEVRKLLTRSDLLLIFYLFGAATVLMFLLFNLFYLSLISGVTWAMIVILSLMTTVKRFYKQAVTRNWEKKP